MDLGICVASHIKDIDYVVHAESLGYSHAWMADSQMIWSDCYATLALAASKTSHIQLGTGVAITGTRPPAVNAAGIATINAIAPGRTFFGVGAGNTAMRIMGLPPHKIKDLDRYLTEIAPLLKGEESIVKLGDIQSPIRHVMPDKGFVNFDDPIPMYVSGFGPRSLGLAGKHGDGAVIAFAASTGALEMMWSMIEAGAKKVDRTIDRDNFYLSALTTMVVLDEGEAIDSPRVKHECGAFAMASVHYAYDQYRNFGHQPPNYLAGIWDDYTKLIESFPEDRRHQRIHAGHNCWVIPEEEKFVTAATISASCLVGTQDQLIEQLQTLGAEGLNQVMLLPPFDPRYDVINRVAKDILPHI
ncbi:MAG: alkanesulfonate monooxygenase SsuD [Candidatus Azotimanducaceae bacterium]|jgi:alkanesulfonate monooxygenase SsuD/methylene tetrahydromethanopterin reductase-like flavin-dependent oxidoreductase (luciferase family)